MKKSRSPFDLAAKAPAMATVSRLFALAAPLAMLSACGQVRPLPPSPACSVTAYRILPTKFHPRLALAPTSLESFAGTGAAPATFAEALARRLQVRNEVTNALRREVLVLSGGSQHGAFGAGFFRGLKAQGKIPDYDVITAVSTGALQSTMVLLANREEPSDRQHFPAYQSIDRGLGKPGNSNIDDIALAYAIGDESDIFDVGSLGYVGAALNGSIGTFRPLRALVGDIITTETIRLVAKEAKAGRSLFVGVTNADDGFGYAVDMTKLAFDGVESGDIAAARNCYIETLVASSSVPPGVPPVALTRKPLAREAGPSTDLYLDGGARFGVFFQQLGPVVHADKPADMTLIVNGFLYSDPWTDKKTQAKPEKWSVASFGLRAIGILQNQVYRLSVADAEEWAGQNGTLKLAFISEEDLTDMTMKPLDWPYPADGPTCRDAKVQDAKRSKPEEFYPAYMRCMIDYGEQRARRDPWNKRLP